MIVGHNHHRLEKRITAAMLSGIPYPREAYFLQQMSERIIHKGKNTWLSDRQAERLFAILTRCESKASPAPRSRPQRLPGPNPTLQPEHPKPVFIEDCLEPTQISLKHSSPQTPATPNASSLTASRPPISRPTPTPEEISELFQHVLQRNQQFRERLERVERQRQKFS